MCGQILKRLDRSGGPYPCLAISSTSENSLPTTKLEYWLAPPVTEASFGDPTLQMPGMVRMAAYHLRRNVERLGMDPPAVKTRNDWGKGTCRFVIDAPISEEFLSAAPDPAVQLVGLRAERIPMSGG
jgi:hypothetical protein